MSHLIILSEPGGCLPGTLHCDCGWVAPVIWHADHGCSCHACYEGYRFLGSISGPGTHPLIKAAPHPRVSSWLERKRKRVIVQ